MTFQTFTGREYLIIDIANNFGLDKNDWSDRIKWFWENEDKLEGLLSSAKDKAMYFAGVKAWKKINQGLPTGYLVSLDATSSGLQILSVLLGDPSAAKLCNVLDTGKRMDAYTEIYRLMLNELGGTSKIERDEVKRAVMTTYYGSEAVPEEVFGFDTPELSTFYKVVDEHTPGPSEFNKSMLKMWSPYMDLHTWLLPDNFHVHCPVIVTKEAPVTFLGENYLIPYKEQGFKPKGKSIGANVIHSCDGYIVREMTRRCNYDPVKIQKVREILAYGKQGKEVRTKEDKLVERLGILAQSSGMLSIRCVDYITESNIGHIPRHMLQEILASLPSKPFPVLSVHDCFRCHPNYGNDLRMMYNTLLSEMGKSNMLSFILSNLFGKEIFCGKIDIHMWKEIKNANYALS